MQLRSGVALRGGRKLPSIKGGGALGQSDWPVSGSTFLGLSFDIGLWVCLKGFGSAN